MVSGEMLKHLGVASRAVLLEIFNQSWKTGIVPAVWKEAQIIPTPKKGKDKKDLHSYRPISILNCVGKQMERVVNWHLINHLETNNILSPIQTGYRNFRSTEDQLAYFAQDIENAFQEKKKKLLAVFFDLSRATDMVWKEGLLLKLFQAIVQHSMYMWIHHFRFARSACITLDSHLSKFTLCEGVPQGDVLSLTLFLVYSNDIMTTITKNVSNTLHADDLAIW